MKSLCMHVFYFIYSQNDKNEKKNQTKGCNMANVNTRVDIQINRIANNEGTFERLEYNYNNLKNKTL